MLKKAWNPNLLELQEQFKILLLNKASHLIGVADMSTGGRDGTIADPKLIFATALKSGANSIIMAHNHPSGSPPRIQGAKSLGWFKSC